MPVQDAVVNNVCALVFTEHDVSARFAVKLIGSGGCYLMLKRKRVGRANVCNDVSFAVNVRVCNCVWRRNASNVDVASSIAPSLIIAVIAAAAAEIPVVFVASYGHGLHTNIGIAPPRIAVRANAFGSLAV